MAVKSLNLSAQKRPNAYKLGVVFVKGFEIVVGDSTAISGESE